MMIVPFLLVRDLMVKLVLESFNIQAVQNCQQNYKHNYTQEREREREGERERGREREREGERERGGDSVCTVLKMTNINILYKSL